MPKILILGYARHGKDTAAEILQREFGLTFSSSSWFCAELVVRPFLAAQGIRYPDTLSCFNDRTNHRAKWYDAICAFNAQNEARLGRLLLAQYDIYCGLRNAQEAKALRNEKVVDLVLWIDASDRGIPVESRESCTVNSEDADIVVKNNGSLEDLRQNLIKIITQRWPSLTKDR